MCRAGVRAVTSGDPNSKDSKRFQTFMFSLAKSFYHELGHMFVTFLGGGVVNTPPHIMVYRSGEPLRAIGEAGRFVEDLLLGGLTNIFKDKEDDDDQVCLFLPGLGKSSARELMHSEGRKTIPLE